MPRFLFSHSLLFHWAERLPRFFGLKCPSRVWINPINKQFSKRWFLELYSNRSRNVIAIFLSALTSLWKFLQANANLPLCPRVVSLIASFSASRFPFQGEYSNWFCQSNAFVISVVNVNTESQLTWETLYPTFFNDLQSSSNIVSSL